MKPLLLLLVLPSLALANPLSLTDTKGRTITATIHGIQGDDLVISREGATHRIPLASLDATSQKAARAAKPAPMIAQETRVRLRAQAVSSGRDTQKYWKTSWGSYDQDVTRTRVITAEAECTLGGGPAEMVVQWVAASAAKASVQGVIKVERLPINLAPGTLNLEAFAARFEESDADYKALGIRDRSGVKYVGWIVRVVAPDGTILATQTSRPTLPAAYPLKPEDGRE